MAAAVVGWPLKIAMLMLQFHRWIYKMFLGILTMLQVELKHFFNIYKCTSKILLGFQMSKLSRVQQFLL